MYKYKPLDFDNIFKLIKDLVAPQKLPSAVFGVTDGNGIIAMEAFGTRPDGSEVRINDIYPIFSVTKPIVGLAIMQLWERGKILLDDPVIKYIPEFGKCLKDRITIWHLLTHTSGLDQTAIFRIFSDKDTSGIDIYNAFINGGVTFEPGIHKNYNNMAFSVMSEIVKRVCGIELPEYLKKNIFSPLGMKDTSFDKNTEEPDRLMPVLEYMGGSIVDIPGLFEKKLPAGGLFSTAADLLALGKALINGGSSGGFKLLGPMTLKAMTMPQTADIPHLYKGDNLKDSEICLTWFIPSEATHSIIYKNVYGHMGASRCNFWVYPEKGVSFAFMTNCINPQPENIHPEYWQQLLNAFSSCLK